MSFKPLFALLIAFLECEVFFFGTASSHGGKSSRSDGKEGIAQVNAFGAARKAGTDAVARAARVKGSRRGDSQVRD